MRVMFPKDGYYQDMILINHNRMIKFCVKSWKFHWLDYIRLPFDIPSQSDFDKMSKKHYNKDIVYKLFYSTVISCNHLKEISITDY